ncbi:MAG: GNAT family N-acetyltransferase [Hyphomicrobiales bacterium]|nr:GNAT family N-acetyltransferase [Hyphomicrobiales bacterium]
MGVQGMASQASVRPLTADDLEAVVDIDRKHSGQTRRTFYSRRLESALKNPKDFIYVGVCEDDALRGFAMARVLGGEFGQENAASLDAIGVDTDYLARGFGKALMSGLEDVMRQKGIGELHTQIEWTDTAQLRFLDRAGFLHSSSIVLERDASPFEEE